MLEVTVTGLKEVEASLKKLSIEIEENNLPLNKELSSNLAQKASSVAPRLTGALASTVVGNPSARKAQIVAGSAAVPYAGVIEYGWPEKNIQAQPYLTKTVYANMGYIVEVYNNYLHDEIKKYNLD
jgi:uncharacterized membrane protein YebE (DUF533 family)